MSNNIIKGQVIPINQANIDTDSIIPKQYLKAITKTGFGPFLFDSWRYKDPGDLSTKNNRRINKEFILIQPVRAVPRGRASCRWVSGPAAAAPIWRSAGCQLGASVLRPLRF